MSQLKYKLRRKMNDMLSMQIWAERKWCLKSETEFGSYEEEKISVTKKIQITTKGLWSISSAFQDK